MTTNLQGKVAFITGAAHGQGRATALALAKEGVHIAAFDIAKKLSYPGYELGDKQELETLVVECESLGVKCLAFAGDVRVMDDISRAIDETIAAFSHIDILFNNAGICAYGLTHEIKEDEWDIMLDVNLKGAWLVGTRIIPIMIAQQAGVIINNSSHCRPSWDEPP